MIPIADRFSALDLKRLCERTLICAMCVENVSRIFALADKYACSRLRGRALLYMTDPNHFHAVMKTDGFAELDKAPKTPTGSALWNRVCLIGYSL